jgi:hypothetical protein
MAQITILQAQGGYVVQDTLTGTTIVKITFVALVEYLAEIFHENFTVEVRKL